MPKSRDYAAFHEHGIASVRCNHFTNDPRVMMWNAISVKHGKQSSVSVNLKALLPSYWAFLHLVWVTFVGGCQTYVMIEWVYDLSLEEETICPMPNMYKSEYFAPLSHIICLCWQPPRGMELKLLSTRCSVACWLGVFLLTIRLQIRTLVGKILKKIVLDERSISTLFGNLRYWDRNKLNFFLTFILAWFKVEPTGVDFGIDFTSMSWAWAYFSLSIWCEADIEQVNDVQRQARTLHK